MASNQTWIEKADLSITNLINEGGYLVPEQAKQFLEIAIEESVLLSLVTTVPMNGPRYELSKIGFTSRVLRPAVEGQALSLADRVKPELGRVNLQTKEFIAEARIPYTVVEDNIQNGTFNDLAMKLLAKAVSRDMEEVVISGDLVAPDPFLAQMNGVLAQVSTNVASAGGIRLAKGTLKHATQLMPSRFLRASKNMAFLTSKNAVIDYSDSLANRGTALGDQKLVSASAAEYAGYPVISIPMMPENISGNTTNVLFCDPKNIHVGIQRDIRIETDRDISAREFIMVATVRFDVKYQHEPAVVKMTNVLAAAGA